MNTPGETTSGFSRARRNLVLLSVFIFLTHFEIIQLGNVKDEPGMISFYVGKVKSDTTDFIVTLIIFQIYFLWRYWTCPKEKSWHRYLDDIRAAFVNRISIYKGKIYPDQNGINTQNLHSNVLKRRYFYKNQITSGKPTTKKIKLKDINLIRHCWLLLRSFMHVSLAKDVFSEVILPFLIGIVALTILFIWLDGSAGSVNKYRY